MKKFKWDKLVIGNASTKSSTGFYIGIFSRLYTFSITPEKATNSTSITFSVEKAVRYYS